MTDVTESLVERLGHAARDFIWTRYGVAASRSSAEELASILMGRMLEPTEAMNQRADDYIGQYGRGFVGPAELYAAMIQAALAEETR